MEFGQAAFPIRQLGGELVGATGHGDELAFIARVDQGAVERDSVGVGHGGVGVAVDEKHRRHGRIQVLQRRKRGGVEAGEAFGAEPGELRGVAGGRA